MYVALARLVHESEGRLRYASDQKATASLVSAKLGSRELANEEYNMNPEAKREYLASAPEATGDTFHGLSDERIHIGFDLSNGGATAISIRKDRAYQLKQQFEVAIGSTFAESPNDQPLYPLNVVSGDIKVAPESDQITLGLHSDFVTYIIPLDRTFLGKLVDDLTRVRSLLDQKGTPAGNS